MVEALQAVECSSSPPLTPPGQPADTTLIAPGLVVDNPLPFRPVPLLASAPSLAAPVPPINPAASGLPFRPAEPPTVLLAPGLPSRLTLEQYASLCAEIAVFPRQVETIFHRYGLVSLHARLTVDLSWQERLRRNPAEYREWQELYKRYHAYWTGEAGKVN